MSARGVCAFAALLVTLLAAGVVEGTEDDRVAALVARARESLAAGRPDLAADLLEARVDGDPATIAPVLLEALRRAQRFESGRELVRRLGPAATERPALAIAVAEWEAEEGWVRRAAGRLDAAIALRPEDGALLAARARLAGAVGEPELALELAGRALAAGVAPETLAWTRAAASIELGRTEEAAALLAPLVAANPGHLAARLALSRLARARGDRAGAIEGLWAVLEREPDHSAALGELGSLLVREPATRARGERALARFRELRDRRERIERLIRERREGRDSGRLRIELAELLLADGRPGEALAVASVPLRVGEPQEGSTESDAELFSNARISARAHVAGRALAALGDSRAAAESLATALRHAPTGEGYRGGIRLDLAEALLASGDTAGAGIALGRAPAGTDPRRLRLAELELAARTDPSWSALAPPLFALLEEHPGDVVVARALADAALALGGDRDPGFRRELVALRGREPAAIGPLLVVAWIALESEAAAADAEFPALDGIAEAMERGAAAGELPDEAAIPDTDHSECWLWRAAREERRGAQHAAALARREARRARALEGPPPG